MKLKKGESKTLKLLGNLCLSIILCSLSSTLVAAEGTSVISDVTPSDLEGPFFNSSEAHQYTDPYRGIYRKGDDFERIILKEIESAKYSVDIAVQELRLPYIAKALARRRQQDGLRVRVILENQYNFPVSNLDPGDSKDDDRGNSRNREYFNFVDMNGDGSLSNYEISERDAVAILANSGITIKDDSSDGTEGSGLMHHKFMIIDSSRVLVTSANFTMSDVHGDYSVPASRGNANALVIFTNANVIRKFRTEFDIMWGIHGFARFGMKKPYRGAQKVALSGGSSAASSVTIQFSPTSKQYDYSESSNGLISKTLKEAKKDVRLALFVFSDQEISNALLDLRKSSRPNIRALVEKTFVFQWYSEALDLLGLTLLSPECSSDLNNNPWKSPIKTVGSPYLPEGDYLHHKFGVVDDRYTIFGSHNWSPSANHTNDETLLVVDDKNVANQFAQEFDRLFKNSNLGPTPSLLNKIRSRRTECRR